MHIAKHNYTEARLRVIWCQSARNKEVAGTNVQLDTRKSFQGRSTQPITLLLPYFDGTVNKNAVVKQYSYNTETSATKSPTEAMWVCWADFYNLSNSTGERLISNTRLTVTLALCCTGSVQKMLQRTFCVSRDPSKKWIWKLKDFLQKPNCVQHPIVNHTTKGSVWNHSRRQWTARCLRCFVVTQGTLQNPCKTSTVDCVRYLKCDNFAQKKLQRRLFSQTVIYLCIYLSIYLIYNQTIKRKVFNTY